MSPWKGSLNCSLASLQSFTCLKVFPQGTAPEKCWRWWCRLSTLLAGVTAACYATDTCASALFLTSTRYYSCTCSWWLLRLSFYLMINRLLGDLFIKTILFGTHRFNCMDWYLNWETVFVFHKLLWRCKAHDQQLYGLHEGLRVNSFV